MFAVEWGTGQVLWSVFWFFLFFMWIWLVITVFADIIRSDDLGGGSKALWAILIIVLPYLGIFLYLIVRGGSMGRRAVDQAREQEEAFRAYVQEAAGGTSPVDQLAKLADLHAAGKLTDAEFEQMKAKLVSA